MLDYGEFVPDALRTSRNNILKVLGQKLELVPYLSELPNDNYESIVDMVLNGTYAHIEAFSYLKILYASAFGIGNNVYFLKEQVYSGNLAFLFPKNTPWKDKFDEVIPRLVQAGIVKKWYDEIMEEYMGTIIEVSFRLCIMRIISEIFRNYTLKKKLQCINGVLNCEVLHKIKSAKNFI